MPETGRAGRPVTTISYYTISACFALWYAATGRPIFEWPGRPVTPAYLITGTALAVAAVVLAVVFHLNRYFLLVFAAACYPFAMQLAFSAFRANLLGHPTPAHLPCSSCHRCYSPCGW